jgi:hypothetical protein
MESLRTNPEVSLSTKVGLALSDTSCYRWSRELPLAISKIRFWQAIACLTVLFAANAVLARAETAIFSPKDLPETKARTDALLSTEDVAACTIGSAQCGASKSGQLSTDDCVLSDKSYIDYYTFQGTAGYTVTIEMMSTAVDTFLILLDPSGTYVDATMTPTRRTPALIFA